LSKIRTMEQLFSKHIKILNSLKTSFKNSLSEKIPWGEKLIGIIGARGVGKTTMLLQHIKETHNLDKSTLYVNLDNITFSYSSLVTLADEFSKKGGKYLFLDEIHKYPNWSIELKNIYDEHSDLQVVFTGSSILDIYKGQADLSRRALVFSMQGLSFREFVQIEAKTKLKSYSLTEILENHTEISIDINKQIKPFQYFESYLQYGYYPYYLQNKDFYLMRLSNTLNQIIENDLTLIEGVNNIFVNKLKRFVNLLANDIPFKPNISSLASAIETSWQSIIKFIEYLERAKILNIIYPHAKGVKSMSKPEKIFLHHPNLFYIFKKDIENKGNLRESFFVNQLSYKHKIEVAKQGDFVIDKKYIFEIGGSKKKFNQISGIENSYVVADEIEYGYENKIPLWLFGFLY